MLFNPRKLLYNPRKLLSNPRKLLSNPRKLLCNPRKRLTLLLLLSFTLRHPGDVPWRWVEGFRVGTRRRHDHWLDCPRQKWHSAVQVWTRPVEAACRSFDDGHVLLIRILLSRVQCRNPVHGPQGAIAQSKDHEERSYHHIEYTHTCLVQARALLQLTLFPTFCCSFGSGDKCLMRGLASRMSLAVLRHRVRVGPAGPRALFFISWPREADIHLVDAARGCVAEDSECLS